MRIKLLSILLRDGVSQNVLDEMMTTCNFKRNKMRNFACISFRFYPFIHPPFDRGLESGAQSHLHGSSCNFYLIEKFAPWEKGAEKYERIKRLIWQYEHDKFTNNLLSCWMPQPFDFTYKADKENKKIKRKVCTQQ